MTRTETIAEGVTLYLGDCREILPTLGKVDAVVTDPPYGLGALWGIGGDGEWPLRDADMKDGAWDKETCDEALAAAMAKAVHVIVWGGNYYDLPPSRAWLLWDKMQEHSTAHAEMAWTNLNLPVRTFRYARAQLASEGKLHPTQKPLPLMKWCIEKLPPASVSVLDPFMGSGTTGVAAVQLGRKFTGIEIGVKYFDMACKRIDAATKQQDLFIEKPKPAKQESWDEMWQRPYTGPVAAE
jgi:DNA modification methylase